MPTYERDGLRLRYDAVGRGPGVLCVHGATATGSYEWSDLADALDSGYRVVVPDLRGHGQSDYRPGEIGIEHVIDDLLVLIDHEHLGRPHLVGFSFGAETALELELTHPGTSASLILLSPGLANPKAVVPTREQLEAGWPRALRSLHATRHGEDHWQHLMVELCERSAQRPATDLDAVAAIVCPILLLAGSDDDPRRIRYARRIEAAHGRSRFVEFDGARHAVHKDRSADVAATIIAFLDKVERSSSEAEVAGRADETAVEPDVAAGDE